MTINLSISHSIKNKSINIAPVSLKSLVTSLPLNPSNKISIRHIFNQFLSTVFPNKSPFLLTKKDQNNLLNQMKHTAILFAKQSNNFADEALGNIVISKIEKQQTT
jgi:hypothetical protein